jgi:RNA polymerase sigma-70 factor (ECF subfamily)
LKWKVNNSICYTAVVKRQPHFYFEMNTSNKITSPQLSDEILIARVAQGDQTALESLYAYYGPTVFGLSLRITGDPAAAEEVLQDTFWRVWKSAAMYQPERGSFRSWLLRIARNLAIDVYRRRGVRPQPIGASSDTDLILDQMPDPEMNVQEEVYTRLKTQQVQNALTALPPEQRQVIELAYFYGMTRQEIADATGEALGTIHTRARLGLQKLREELKSRAGW